MDRLRTYLIGALLGIALGALLGAQSNHRARRQAETRTQQLEDENRTLRGRLGGSR